MADGFVQVPVDSTGKKIDVSELIRADGTTVERQRLEIPGGVIVNGDVLNQILIELRLGNMLLAQGLNITDDIDAMRNDMINQNII